MYNVLRNHTVYVFFIFLALTLPGHELYMPSSGYLGGYLFHPCTNRLQTFMTSSLSVRFRWRLVPHLQPQRGQDQSDGQHLPEVLQGAAGARG